MRQYLVMQEPPRNERDFAPAVYIINVETAIGRGRLERLKEDGCRQIGVLEIEDDGISLGQFYNGLTKSEQMDLAMYQWIIDKIKHFVDDGISEYYKEYWGGSV